MGNWDRHIHKPLKPRKCQHCIYAVKLTGQSRTLLVCTNRPDSAGRLSITEPAGLCRNFKPPRVVAKRTKVKQPKNNKIRYIPLTQGKVAIVDAEDYERLTKHKWYAYKRKDTCYAYRYKNRSVISMHREIIKAPKNKLVDHIDRNGLNNTRANLRLCTSAENMRNRRGEKASSKYKGVHWHKKSGKWVASITLNGRKFDLGGFDSESDAAKAYDKKAAEFFGEFAYLNFTENK